MSSIITGVLKLTFGLFWDKLRDHTAERLQDGDVTDEKCRQIIVRELDNIKSVLDGLSRMDLLASISFLKEGVCLLNNVFGLATTGDVTQCEIQETKKILTGGQSSHEIVNIASDSEERFEEAIEQLSLIISNLDTASKDNLSSARMSFADARREATRAFNNKALSTKDRILACKLRVISRLLENIETPTVAVETCILYLEELHQLEAIREIFSVHITGGLKSRFNKRKRQQLMSSVIMINYVLANFTLQFAGKKYNLLNWPKVQLSSRRFHPLLDPAANDIMHGIKIGAPNIFVFDRMPLQSQKLKLHNQMIIPGIMATGSGHLAEIIIKDGEMHLCFFQNLDEICADRPKMLLFATNEGDNTYVVAYVKTSDNEFDFFLLIADQSGKLTRETNLKFLSRAEKQYRKSARSDELDELPNRPTHVEFTVNGTANIFIIGHLTYIHVCDSNVELTHCFETTDRNDLVYITSSNDVITARYSSNTVYIYCMKGNKLRQFNVAQGQVIYDVVSHDTLGLIYALTRNGIGAFQLEIYTHLGEHRASLDLVRFNFSALLKMREGPVAIIYDKGFILI